MKTIVPITHDRKIDTMLPIVRDSAALLRLCDVHNVPVATHDECAQLLISAFDKEAIT